MLHFMDIGENLATLLRINSRENTPTNQNDIISHEYT